MNLYNSQNKLIFKQRSGTMLCMGKLEILEMKVANSVKTLKSRHRACKMVKRKGRLYIINKQIPKFKARQG